MSIRKIIRQIIKESLIVETDEYNESELSYEEIYQTSNNDSLDSFVIETGDMSGIKFDQQVRLGSLEAAKEELGKWKGRKDSDASTHSILKGYWKSYYGKNNPDIDHIVKYTNNHSVEMCPPSLQNPNHSGGKTYHPWSAVFIRHCMIKGGYTSPSGLPETFNHISHEKFFIKAYMNRKEIIKNRGKNKNINKYVLFFLDEIKPQDLKPGDNIFKFRPAIGEDEAKKWFKNATLSTSANTHSDIYSGNGNCIGGNMSDTVKEYPVDDHVAVVKWIENISFDPRKSESDIFNAEVSDSVLDEPDTRKT